MVSSVLPETRRWSDLAGVVGSGVEKGRTSLVWARGTLGKGEARFGLRVCLGNDFRKAAASEHWWRIALEKSEEFLNHFYSEKYLHFSVDKHPLYLKISNPIPNLKWRRSLLPKSVN